MRDPRIAGEEGTAEREQDSEHLHREPHLQGGMGTDLPGRQPSQRPEFGKGPPI